MWRASPLTSAATVSPTSASSSTLPRHEPSLPTSCHGVARDLRSLTTRSSRASTGIPFHFNLVELMPNKSQYSLIAIPPNCRRQLRLSHAPSLNVGRGIPTQNPQKKSPPKSLFFFSLQLAPPQPKSDRLLALPGFISSPTFRPRGFSFEPPTPAPVDQRKLSLLRQPPFSNPGRCSPTELHESIVSSSDRLRSAFRADSIRPPERAADE